MRWANARTDNKEDTPMKKMIAVIATLILSLVLITAAHAETVETTEQTAVETVVEEVAAEETVVEETAAEETAAEEVAAEETVVEETAAEETIAAETDVRLEGDGLSEIIETIPEGAELEVLGVEGDWVKVQVNGKVGYVHISDMPAEETEEAEETVEREFKVTIFSSRRSVMADGETVFLTSRIEGFEGLEIMYQWSVDKGNGFEVIDGANSDSYSFEASVETLSYDWKLTVFYR